MKDIYTLRDRERILVERIADETNVVERNRLVERLAQVKRDITAYEEEVAKQYANYTSKRDEEEQ